MLATNKRMNQFYHKRLPGMDLDVGTVLAVLNPDAYLESGLFLLCNGAVVSRTTYARLFNFVSTHNLIRSTEEIADLNASEDYAFGPGDGSTTFSIPNMIGRTIFGGTNVGKYQKEQLPNISGVADDSWYSLAGSLYTHNSRNGMYSTSFIRTWYVAPSQNNGGVARGVSSVGCNASYVTSVYVDGGAIKPLTLNMNYVIKC